MLGMSNDSNDFTQKDLMKHLLDTAQHAATRGDLQTAETNIGRRIERVQDEIGQVRNELKQEIVNVRSELKQDIADLRTELKQDIAELREEIKEVRTELKSDHISLKSEVKELRNKMDRMTWAICGTIVVAAVTMIFKDVLLAGLIS